MANMKVYAFDPFVDKKTIEADGVIAVDSAEELYKKCQYVSLHIPSNEKTKQSINKELLSIMPKGAVLVNTARKEVIHEEELLELMNERDDFKYLSDIAPVSADTFKENFSDRIFFTPKKMGAQTAEANINSGIATINQIIACIENGDETFKVK